MIINDLTEIVGEKIEKSCNIKTEPTEIDLGLSSTTSFETVAVIDPDGSTHSIKHDPQSENEQDLI